MFHDDINKGGDAVPNYSIGKFADLIGVTPQTLRNWHKEGQLVPAFISQGGTRYYSDDQLNRMLLKNKKKQRVVVGYCRVSSNKQKDDLSRQVESMTIYLTSQGQPFEIITDIGSGINYSNKGLQQLVQRVCRGEVEKIVVLFKDRLVRFGFELIEYVSRLHGTQIEIVDSTNKTEEEELVEDLIQIVTVFSCRLQGKRAHQAKRMVRELVQND